MSRYFLDLHECGNVTRDDEGVERVDIGTVHADAVQAARDVMCAEVKDGRLCLSCSIEVRDATGATVLSVPFRDAVAITGQ